MKIAVNLENIEEQNFNNKEQAYKISLEKFRKLTKKENPFSPKSFKKTCLALFAQEMNFYLCNGSVYLYPSSGSFEQDLLKLEKLKQTL